MNIQDALKAQTLATPASSIASSGGGAGSGTPLRIPMWQGGGIGLMDSYLTGPAANLLTIEASANSITLTVPGTGTAVLEARTISAGNGLTGGGDLTANRTLTLGTPSTLTVATTNLVSGTTHTHAITTSAAPGAAAAILATTAAGLLTLQSLAVTNVASGLIPLATDTYDLGSSGYLWRKGYLSELDAVLFAINTVTLLGGWFVVGKDEGILPVGVAALDTEVDFGKTMTVGHFVKFAAALKLEYMQVGTLIGGTLYNVTRNLDGSGLNQWTAGTPFLVLGTTGDGRIELNSYDTPRISITKQGATYNAQTEMARWGDLNGNWGYGAETYGIALGDYAASHANLTWDPTNGLRLRNYTATVIQLDNAGAATIQNANITTLNVSGALTMGASGVIRTAASGQRIELTQSLLAGYAADGTTKQFYIQASDGKAYAGGGNVMLDIDGEHITPYNFGDTPIGYGFALGHGLEFTETGSIGGFKRTNTSQVWTTSGINTAIWPPATGDKSFTEYHVSLLNHNQNTRYAYIDLLASEYGGMIIIYPDLNVGSVSALKSNGDAWLGADVRAGGGLYVGGTGVDPAAGTIYATVSIDAPLIGTSGTWTPTFTGFSVNPANPICRYVLIGKLCTIFITLPNTGTSNATTFIITLPFTSANVNASMSWTGTTGYSVDNGTALTTPAMWYITNNSGSVNLFKNISFAAWTNTGAKGSNFTAQYEIA